MDQIYTLESFMTPIDFSRFEDRPTTFVQYQENVFYDAFYDFLSPPSTLPKQKQIPTNREYQLPLSPESPYQKYNQVTPKQNLKDLSAAERKAMREQSRNLTCHNCGVQKTPLWRRTPDKKHSLCNACGLYLKQYNASRPMTKQRTKAVVSKKKNDKSLLFKDFVPTAYCPSKMEH